MKMYAVNIYRDSYGLEYIVTVANNEEEAIRTFDKEGYNLGKRDIKNIEEYEIGEVFRCSYVE